MELLWKYVNISVGCEGGHYSLEWVLKQTSLIFFSAGGVVASLVSLSPLLPNSINFPSWITFVGIVIAIGLVVLGFFMGGAGIIWKISKALLRKLFQPCSIRCRLATVDDLDYVYSISNKYFGDQSSTRLDIQRIFDTDKQNIHIAEKVIRKENGKKKIESCGYYLVFRICRAGEAALLNGSFNGSNPALEHLSHKGKAPSAIYIGGIAAEFRARASIVSRLTGMLEESPRYAVTNVFYARAATKAGLRLLLVYDFVPLFPDQSGVGKLYKLAQSKP